ncbi:MAG: sodium:proton exchanger [Marinilabiliales bacterium]|nr:MAG: sodium:proton exchanger [Marinilabiliales bacterium]
MTTEFLFFLGFVVLIFGANLLVEGSASLGKRLGIPSIVIGLTIVAFGTSLPELVISGVAAWQGKTDLAIANVMGSNLLNILIILGITAIIAPIPSKKSTTNKVIPGSFLITVVLLLAVYSFNKEDIIIKRWEGIIFLVLFLVFIQLNRRASRNYIDNGEQNNIKDYNTLTSILLIVFGLGALFISGRWIVNGASEIAIKLRISQSVIGLTMVALATSLPELVTSVIAALKKNPDIAIGNVVGSNIFNILLVLGASATIRPLENYPDLSLDLGMVLVATFALFIMLYFGRRKYVLQRHEGVILVLIYIIYIIVRL